MSTSNSSPDAGGNAPPQANASRAAGTQSRPAIIDRRELEFSRVGVLRAVRSSLRAASAFGLPPVPPTDVRLLPHEGKACLVYGNGPNGKSVLLDAVPLGALLVSYCIRLRIPIPRSADKGVHIEENAVVLGFRIERDDDLMPDLEEAESIQHSPVRAWSWVTP